MYKIYAFSSESPGTVEPPRRSHDLAQARWIAEKYLRKGYIVRIYSVRLNSRGDEVESLFESP